MRWSCRMRACSGCGWSRRRVRGCDDDILLQTMKKAVIRNLDERTVARLKRRAARNARSLQAELQMIIARAAITDVAATRTLAARIRQKLSDRKHTDSAMLIAEDRRR